MGSIKHVSASQKNSDTNEVKMRAVHTPKKREGGAGEVQAIASHYHPKEKKKDEE